MYLFSSSRPKDNCLVKVINLAKAAQAWLELAALATSQSASKAAYLHLLAVLQPKRSSTVRRIAAARRHLQ
jgi:hypothetical protein